MIKQIILLITSTLYFHVTIAQTTDEQIEKLINTEDYFGLIEILSNHKNAANSSVYNIGKAIALHHSMRYNASNQIIDTIIQDKSIDFDTRYVMTMLKAENHKQLKNRTEAINTYNTLLKDLNYREHREMIEEINRLKMAELNSYAYPAITINKKHDKNQIPIEYTEKSIFISVKSNKKETLALFDTGATMNVVSSRIARQMKMKLLNDSIQINGTVNDAGFTRIALAEKIKIGDITLNNIPFVIIEPIEHPENKQIKPIEMVIGFPVISALKHIRICRDEQIIEISNSAKEKQTINMLSAGGCPFIRLYSENKPLTFVLDSGASSSWLTEKYYRDNEPYIITNANPDQRELAGIGGSQYYTVFDLKHFYIDINNRETDIGPIDVFTQIIPGFQQMPNDGLIGNDFLYRFKYVTLDFEQMNISFEE